MSEIQYSQETLNQAVKTWLESKGFKALVTGNKREFVVQVKDLFPTDKFLSL